MFDSSDRALLAQLTQRAVELVDPAAEREVDVLVVVCHDLPPPLESPPDHRVSSPSMPHGVHADLCTPICA